MSVKAAIFDMDGVLIDTEKHLVACWCEAAREAGFPMEWKHGLMIRSLAMKYAEPRLQQIFGKEFNYQAIRSRRKELVEERLLKFGLEKKPYADELLDALRKLGIKTAVATATDEERAERYLKQLGLYDRFDRIVCATMVENGKPEPDIYRYACEQIGEKPEDCVALEDSPNGVQSAFRAGCRVIMVPDLTLPEEGMEEQLTAVAENLRAAIEIIRQM